MLTYGDAILNSLINLEVTSKDEVIRYRETNEKEEETKEELEVELR